MRRVILPILFGLICWAAAIVIVRWNEYSLAKAQVQASDLFMVSVQGPRLGACAVSPDIVLLFFDYQTANNRGYVSSFTDDLQLYRKLVKAGARVIYDSRLVASADRESFQESRPLLDGIREIDSEGKVLRNVWLSSSLEAESGHLYDQINTQFVIDSRPHALPGIASRLYPLAYFTSDGIRESAPLVLYRKMHQLPAPTMVEVGDQLRLSGIMSAWHEYAPRLVPKTDVPKAKYQLGDFAMAWQAFAPASSLVPPAGFFISYGPLVNRYERLSYDDVLKSESLPDVKDKLVLIGFAADIDPSSDSYEVPNLVGKATAIEVIACAVQTLLDHRTMREIPRSLLYLVMLLFILAMAILTGLAKPIQAVFGGVGLLVVYFLLASIAYRYGWYADFMVTPVAAIFCAVPAAATNAWLNLRARQRVVDLFGRYVPRAIVNQLIQKSDLQNLTLGGTKREVTVMFADIRGFTSFSQYLPPEQVVQELNSLLEVMVKCTFDYEGTLDKFIGDAILVLFNAPLDQADHTERAVKTAIAIQKSLRDHASGLKVGIGVHSGPAVIGNIGTPQRMEFTAIGKTVNIASRLCDLAAPGEIVVSETVMQSVGDRFSVEQIGSVSVKGISDELKVGKISITA